MQATMNARPVKRRKVSPSRGSEKQGLNGVHNAFLKNAANWSLEENYESRARKKKKTDKQSDRLPIRSADGILRPMVRDDLDEGSSDDDDGDDNEDGDNAETGNGHTGAQTKRARAAAAAAAAAQLRADRPRLSEAEQIRTAKEELAKIALKLNESPEENPGAFKALARISHEYPSVAVQKLCLATQMAVYKDVIPGYRIRTFAEEPVGGEKLSSDVRRIRAYEQSLLAGYQGYLRELQRVAKLRPTNERHHHGNSKQSGNGQQPSNATSLADVALSCACTLVNSVPHFNFREDLLRILVGKLSTRRVDASFVKCRTALETLFREDDEGRPSTEAVGLLSKMMRARDYRVDESVLNTFLHLRLLSEFAGKGSQNSVERPGDDAAAAAAAAKGKFKAKQKKEFRTKRERKLLKEQKVLDRDLAQADALVGHEERERMQSETLKLVFATYFRILKLRTPHLMGAVLEGLAKYAHLINQDFFGDLLEALKDLIRHSEEESKVEAQDGADGEEEVDGEGEEHAADVTADDDNNDDDDDDDDDEFNVARNTSREALLCTVTAYALLAGQDAHNAKGDLHLDLSFFTTHLFRSLFPLALSPDLEARANSLQQQLLLADDAASSTTPRGSNNNNNKVNLQTTTVLLIRCLTAVLLPPYNIRSVPPLRLAAFAKQLMSASLHVPEKSSQALLALLHDVAHTHGKKISALWRTEERKGDGAFNPLSETVEGSNPFATTVWEGELLRRHFCPKVREGVKALEKSLMQ
ncbi:nuclear export protein noc3 [Niveomyces insectorum RCEF 264]|uniref:Nucleolar complex-associated protein 3 n=1 Tax=Niveomyces insectorum RCEF 264 TaxID=1081102 RepID=A0A167M1V5_9HYPO|nr:nuclear export protein noc3 [Niveomyces insectorum RCEF 264]